MMAPELERILVLAKTYPEISKKHGPLVCVAGINQFGEFRRLYPVPFNIWHKKDFEKYRFQKWDFIEVSTRKPSHDPREESKEIDWRTIRVVDQINSKHWSVRLGIIRKFLDKDLEYLKNSGRSLGIIKPREVTDFLIKKRSRISDKGELDVLDKTLPLIYYFSTKDKYLLPALYEKDVKIENLPWIGYKFFCDNPKCNGHEMMAIDWEIQELYRTHKDNFEKVKQKAYYWMTEKRDLYFMVGNTWRFHKSFMIISVIYPPKGTLPQTTITPYFKEKPKTPGLNHYLK